MVNLIKLGNMNGKIIAQSFMAIEKVCSKTVRKPRESKERLRSERIDRILTGRYTAIPAFVLIMGAVFWLTFNVIGAFFQDLLERGSTRSPGLRIPP